MNNCFSIYTIYKKEAYTKEISTKQWYFYRYVGNETVYLYKGY